jgi:microcompartment protein CcmK/EutM
MPDDQTSTVPTKPADKPQRLLTADEIDGNDLLVVQFLDPNGAIREQFAGVRGERKAGDPTGDGPVTWILPVLAVARHQQASPVRIMVIGMPGKWRGKKVEKAGDGYAVECEKEVKS